MLVPSLWFAFSFQCRVGLVRLRVGPMGPEFHLLATEGTGTQDLMDSLKSQLLSASLQSRTLAPGHLVGLAELGLAEHTPL